MGGTGGGYTDDPRASSTVYGFLIGIGVFLLIFVGLTAYFRKVDKEEKYTKVVTRTPEDLARLLAEQRARLTGYRWLDPEKGKVAIPIDRAMELVVKEYGGKQR